MSPYEIVEFKFDGRNITVTVIDMNKPEEEIKITVTPAEFWKMKGE